MNSLTKNLKDFQPDTLYRAVLVATGMMLVACSDSSSSSSSSVDKPSQPRGLGYELTVSAPGVVYPLPAFYYAENNADSDTKYNLGDNPIATLIAGINDIWQGTTDDWQAAASSSGPAYGDDDSGEWTTIDWTAENTSDYPIIDADIWQENIDYVIDVTANRTDDEAILAFLDDRRSKNYSVIDGYGPLTETYVNASGAYTDITAPTTDEVLVDTNYLADSNDDIVYAGDEDETLGAVYTLVYDFRQASPASTSGSKYIFSTPRPWRISDDGTINYTGTSEYTCVDSGSTETTVYYDAYDDVSVSVVPGLLCARRTNSSGATEDNRRKDGAFPSGHTNAGYLAAMAYAYALPQRFSEMLTRASQLGEDRIIAGMHSPLDIIAARIDALAVASYALNQSDIMDDATNAYDAAQSYFGALAAADEMTLYDYAHTTVDSEDGLTYTDGDTEYVNVDVYDNNIYDDHDEIKELYRERMTYGFTQDSDAAGDDPVVPLGAEVLLKSRQPYLTAAQRRAVLYTTEVDSGYPVLDDSNGWGRIDLVTAADGYGEFVGDVSVTMDAADGGFSEQDWWRNDISGDGLLTKAGSGQLTLTGDNSYTGGTLLEEGTLEAESTTAFGSGDLYVTGGTVLVNADGALVLSGNFTMDDGDLTLTMDDDSAQMTVASTVYLDGGSLVLDFDDYTPSSGDEFKLITGATVYGEFADVDAGDYTVTLEYTDTSIIATVE